MTKAENDYQYTLEKRIVDLEADNRRLNQLNEAINYTRSYTELKDKPKLNFGDWKFSQGLRYTSDFTYKNAKGELFDADVVNNAYNDYYNLAC